MRYNLYLENVNSDQPFHVIKMAYLNKKKIHYEVISHRTALGGSRSSNYIIGRMRPSDTSLMLRIRMRFTFSGRRKPTRCLLSLNSLFSIYFKFRNCFIEMRTEIDFHCACDIDCCCGTINIHC